MDMSKFLGDQFYITIQELQDGPVEGWIYSVDEVRFENSEEPRPVMTLVLDDGTRRGVVLNATSIRMLIEGYGPESNDWRRKRVKISLSHRLLNGRYTQLRLVSPLPKVAPVKVFPEPSAKPDDEKVPF